MDVTIEEPHKSNFSQLEMKWSFNSVGYISSLDMSYEEILPQRQKWRLI